MSSQNEFGNSQSTLDLKADEIIFSYLKKSGVVHSAASEEKPYVSILANKNIPFNCFESQ